MKLFQDHHHWDPLPHFRAYLLDSIKNFSYGHHKYLFINLKENIFEFFYLLLQLLISVISLVLLIFGLMNFCSLCQMNYSDQSFQFQRLSVHDLKIKTQLVLWDFWNVAKLVSYHHHFFQKNLHDLTIYRMIFENVSHHQANQFQVNQVF